MMAVQYFSHDGLQLAYEDFPSTGPALGETVVMVMGTGSPGRVWNFHQVPALTAAGYRVVTLTNRGIAPSDTDVQGFTIDDMARRRSGHDPPSRYRAGGADRHVTGRAHRYRGGVDAA